jgi:hypothetical protein
MAFLAYHFHWSLDQILALEHSDRRTWVSQISAINEGMNGET